MPDGFTEMVTTARRFLGELEHNNQRDWFDRHKAQFKSEIDAPLKLLTTLFEEDLSRLTGVAHTGKVGRIYRDVRFSKDKSPYNTHVHAYWMQAGGTGPGWLLRIDPAGVQIMTGLHALDADGIARYRAAVDRDGDSLEAVIATGCAAGAAMIAFGDTTLKRVPKPYAADHPQGDLLRRKQIALGLTLSENALADGLMPAMIRSVETLLPFWRWCDRAIC